MQVENPSALIRDDLMHQVSESNPFVWSVWQPERLLVVLGNAQQAENEVDGVACAAAGVPVVKRRGGGGAVVLMPGFLCFSLAFRPAADVAPRRIFELINTFIIDVLARNFAVCSLRQAGISDIALGDRKILGCSLFKSRRLVFYQGSLSVDPKLDWIDRLLLHPSREPDYRAGRPHRDFLTSLHRSGYAIDLQQLKTVFESEIERDLGRILANSLDIFSNFV